MDEKAFNDLAYDLSQNATMHTDGDLMDATAVLLAAAVFCARTQFGDNARLVLTQLLDRWAPPEGGEA